MILYLDTSSLVKLYVQERHSEAVHGWAQHTDVFATSRVAFPEMLAALARRRREGDFDAESFQLVAGAFKQQWLDFAIIELDPGLFTRRSDKPCLEIEERLFQKWVCWRSRAGVTARLGADGQERVQR